jgi:hypothetical protein
MAGETTSPKRGAGRPFQVGNPGRPKGSRNKLTEDFIASVAAEWARRGDQAMTELTAKELADVAGKLMPKDINITHEVQLSDDERSSRIAQLSAALGLGIGVAAAAHRGAGGEGSKKPH